MGFVRKTPGGAHRACWRDPAGRQRSKTFRTKREANAFLSEVESAVNRGTYVDPDAGRIRFGTFAARWLLSREVEARKAERTLSIMRAHVLPQWSEWPLSRIDHMAVQEWVTALGRRRARGTVVRCHSVLSMILKTAIRARLIAINPAEGVKIPANRQARKAAATVSQSEFFRQRLPAVPQRYQALVCAAAGAGLRWGECAGLRWGDIDLARARLTVEQVAVETPASVTLRPFPKSRAGRRTVPMPAFLVDALTRLRGNEEPAADALVFPSRSGGPLRRNNFRRPVWLPSLVRAGLLGQVDELAGGFHASWRGSDGKVRDASFRTRREAVAQVAKLATGGRRFHDLRHSYATWLVSEGLPVTIVRLVMGHEQTSTTLDIYTHTPDDYKRRVTDALNGSAAYSLPPDGDTVPDDEDQGNDDDV